MNIAFPFRYDGRGRAWDASDDRHVRDLIEQVLFTSPGERVNRPTFGSGLLRLVFEPGGEALAAAIQVTVQGSLQQWLGELIRVEGVEVSHAGESLRVLVRYRLRQGTQAQSAEFVRKLR